MLTKKQREFMRSQKCEVDPPKEPPLHYLVHMSLTKGELMALKHAVQSYDSPVAEDVRAYLLNALTRAGIDLDSI